MNFNSVGQNIRKYRLLKKLRQEDLAEKANLSVTYIGMLERGEKNPSLETFVNILNALDISADMVLCDILNTGYKVKDSILNEKLSLIADQDRAKIYDVVETMLAHSKRKI